VSRGAALVQFGEATLQPPKTADKHTPMRHSARTRTLSVRLAGSVSLALSDVETLHTGGDRWFPLASDPRYTTTTQGQPQVFPGVVLLRFELAPLQPDPRAAAALVQELGHQQAGHEHARGGAALEEHACEAAEVSHESLPSQTPEVMHGASGGGPEIRGANLDTSVPAVSEGTGSPCLPMFHRKSSACSPRGLGIE